MSFPGVSRHLRIRADCCRTTPNASSRRRFWSSGTGGGLAIVERVRGKLRRQGTVQELENVHTVHTHRRQFMKVRRWVGEKGEGKKVSWSWRLSSLGDTMGVDILPKRHFTYLLLLLTTLGAVSTPFSASQCLAFEESTEAILIFFVRSAFLLLLPTRTPHSCTWPAPSRSRLHDGLVLRQ